MQTAEGYLFDITSVGSEIILWIKTKSEMIMLSDIFFPQIYVSGQSSLINKFLYRLQQLDALAAEPEETTKLDFYSGTARKALKLSIARPEILKKIKQKQYVFYGRMDIFHADVEIPVLYLQYRQSYPLARVKVSYTMEASRNILLSLETLCSHDDLEYSLPDISITEISLSKGFRNGFHPPNSLLLKTNHALFQKKPPAPSEDELELFPDSKGRYLEKITEFITKNNPDIILSSYGDQIIFPEIFSKSQHTGISLNLDRGFNSPWKRKINKKGNSYVSYGMHIFRATSYPLLGRWHIDTKNSFVYREAHLRGIFELSRLSCLPVQRIARMSTGGALTAIETETAVRRGYLVPWQKSRLENIKTAYQLLQIDKGGLTYQPDIRNGRTYERVAQIDFSQMYPTIMSLHNISPETVNCLCCKAEQCEKVPQTHYYICAKRRGIVSESLENILKRRKYYKDQLKVCSESDKPIYEARQSSLKWMLVTSFGYLGYRNAKFGKLESHEAVSAFGREKLLTAKDIAEDRGFHMLHALTDCLFLHWPEISDQEFYENIHMLLKEIYAATGIDISLDGIYSWLVFLPSNQRPGDPVSTRYLGRFTDGSLKLRGIAARRKDTPPFILYAQLGLLKIMKTADTLEQLKSLRPQVRQCYEETILSLKNLVNANKPDIIEKNLQSLMFRKTITRNPGEYKGNGANRQVLHELERENIQVAPGEKIKYLILRDSNCAKRKYLSEEMFYKKGIPPRHRIHLAEYIRLTTAAFHEIYTPFCPEERFEPPELFDNL